MKLNIVARVMAVLGGFSLAMLFIAQSHQTHYDHISADFSSVQGRSNHITYSQADVGSPVSQPIDEPEPVIQTPNPEIEPLQSISGIFDVPKVYDVPLDGEIQSYILQLCEEKQIDPVLVFAIMKVESGFDPTAVSKTNDYGLMQINKINHKGYNEILGITDFLDAKQGALAGIYMLWDLRENYGCDTENKMLMAYNRGIVRAKKLWAQGIFSNTYTTSVADAKKTIRKFS